MNETTNSNKGQKLNFWIAVISLVTAILSLIAASISLKQVATTRAEVSELKEINATTINVWGKLDIHSPLPKAEIREETIEMEGSIEGGIPEGYDLWVFALSDAGQYFLQTPKTIVDSSNNRWIQKGIKLNIKGNWELHVCIATEEASDMLRKRITGQINTGFSSLPDGVKTIKFVKIKRT